jgi:hypothetical protein
MPHAAVNAMLADAYPHGSLNYWKPSFVKVLSDEAIRYRRRALRERR